MIVSAGTISNGMIKKMTIDTLARMTQDEFSRMDGKFEARFDKVDNDMAEMKSTLKTILHLIL